jgi:hypothetical protein
MTDAVQVALIAAGSVVVSTIGGVYIAWFSLKKKTDQDKFEMMAQVSRLEINIDGRLTQILDLKDQIIAGKDAKNAATAISSEALGVLKEKERNEAIK